MNHYHLIESDEPLHETHVEAFRRCGIRKIEGASNFRGFTADRLVSLLYRQVSSARMAHCLRLHNHPMLAIRIGTEAPANYREAEILVRRDPQAEITLDWDYVLESRNPHVRLTCAYPYLRNQDNQLRREVGRIKERLLRFQDRLRVERDNLVFRRVAATPAGLFAGSAACATAVTAAGVVSHWGPPKDRVVTDIPGPASGIREQQGIGRLRRARPSDTLVGVAIEDIQAGQLIGFGKPETPPKDDYPLNDSLRDIEERRLAGVIAAATGIAEKDIRVSIRELADDVEGPDAVDKASIKDSVVRRAVDALLDIDAAVHFAGCQLFRDVGSDKWERGFTLVETHSFGKAIVFVTLPPKTATEAASEHAKVEKTAAAGLEESAATQERRKSLVADISKVVRRYSPDFDVHSSAVPPSILVPSEHKLYSDAFNEVLRKLGGIRVCARSLYLDKNDKGNHIYVALEKGVDWAWLVVPEAWAVDFDKVRAVKKASEDAGRAKLGDAIAEQHKGGRFLAVLSKLAGGNDEPPYPKFIGTVADFGRSQYASYVRTSGMASEATEALEKRIKGKGLDIVEKWTSSGTLSKEPALCVRVGNVSVTGGDELYVVYTDPVLFKAAHRTDNELPTSTASASRDTVMTAADWIERMAQRHPELPKLFLDGFSADDFRALARRLRNVSVGANIELRGLPPPPLPPKGAPVVVREVLVPEDNAKKSGLDIISACFRKHVTDFIIYARVQDIETAGWTLFPHTAVKALTPDGADIRDAIEAEAGLTKDTVGFVYHVANEQAGTVWALGYHGTSYYVVVPGWDLAIGDHPAPLEALPTEDEKILRDEGYAYEGNARNRMTREAYQRVSDVIEKLGMRYTLVPVLKTLPRLETPTLGLLRELQTIRVQLEGSIPQRLGGEGCWDTEKDAHVFQFQIMTADGRDIDFHLVRKV